MFGPSYDDDLSDGFDDSDPWTSPATDDYCDGCNDYPNNLFYCLPCAQTLCDQCWNQTPAHGDRNRQRFPGIVSIKHEKTPLPILKAVQPAFFSPPNETTFESMLKEDEQAAWFGK
jgi:hypothetical protein